MTKVIDFNKKRKNSYSDMTNNLKFGLYNHKVVSQFGTLRVFYFIVLKEKETDVILEFTPFSDYLRHTVKSIDTRRPETIRAKGVYICQFLNYVFFEKYNEFKITNIHDITIEHGNKFLQDYANGLTGKKSTNPDGTPKVKSRDTISQAMRELANFYTFIQKKCKSKAKHIYKKDIFTVTSRYNNETKSYEDYSSTIFKIKLDEYPNADLLLRNMTTKVFTTLLKLCDIYYPEIKLALALQAFGGLRAGEVCNCRQLSSPYGGVKLQKMGTELVKFEVDLTRKVPMRSDLVDVGDIKKTGIQRIYEPFLPIFSKIYDEHMNWLKQQDFENDYCPLFLNRDNKAMTYKSYHDKFYTLANVHLKRELLNHEDSELRNFGKTLEQYVLGTHALRHWFTVQLVLDNLTPDEIATWRRDTNLNSALKYCARKDELKRAHSKANELLIKELFGNSTN